MEFELIETPRLILRALTPEVYDHVFTSYSNEEIKIFFGCQSEAEFEEERKKFTERLSMYRKSLKMFQLIDKESNAVIGWCGYHTWYYKHNRAEIGYVLSEEAKKNQGYMKEALPFVIRHGFRNMGLKRIEAMVGADNVPSLKLLQTFGFVLEGNLREHYFVNGVYEDSLMFSLLDHEFSA